MKAAKRFSVVAGTLLAALVQSIPVQALAADLTVVVSGLRSQTGQVLIALHDNSANFPNKWSRAIAVQRAPAADGQAVKFENLAAGRYAVIAVHDEDRDGEMTKTFIGLPREGFGTSNNPTFFSAPRFGPAAFELRENAALSIRMVYF